MTLKLCNSRNDIFWFFNHRLGFSFLTKMFSPILKKIKQLVLSENNINKLCNETSQIHTPIKDDEMITKQNQEFKETVFGKLLYLAFILYIMWKEWKLSLPKSVLGAFILGLFSKVVSFITPAELIFFLKIFWERNSGILIFKVKFLFKKYFYYKILEGFCSYSTQSDVF